jgi:hypothetical protein
MLIHFLTNDAFNCQAKVRFFIRFQIYFGILILHKLQAFLTNIHFHPNKYNKKMRIGMLKSVKFIKSSIIQFKGFAPVLFFCRNKHNICVQTHKGGL